VIPRDHATCDQAVRPEKIAASTIAMTKGRFGLEANNFKDMALFVDVRV